MTPADTGSDTDPVSITDSITDSITWVIGSGGLLGRAVVRRIEYRGGFAHTSPVAWHDPDAAATTLLGHARTVLDEADRIRILWCAGAGIIGTSQEALDQEVDLLSTFFTGLTALCAERPDKQVSVFLASSAGGVYAGSAGGPFTEATTPVPLAAYGKAKLAAEQVAADFARTSGAHVLIGRIANLYGPGQDLRKPQGLISQLCRSQLERRPLMMYVSLDTARDYIFVDDAADMIIAGLRAVELAAGRQPVVKIISSGQSTTLAAIIGEIARITRRRPAVTLGASPTSSLQAARLDFRSVVLPELASAARTPLPAGILATLDSVAGQLRRAS